MFSISTVFIFHGIEGNSQENWFPWLKKEVDVLGHRAIVPEFPHSDAPVLDEWLEHLEKYKDSIDERTVFVGHSLGAAFALRALERMMTPIAAAFLVAPVWCVMGNTFDPLMTSFTEPAYDWERIRKHADTFSVVYSDNDPYIRPELSLELAKHLGVKPQLIKGGGHFNKEAGYKEFPKLLEIIKQS